MQQTAGRIQLHGHLPALHQAHVAQARQEPRTGERRGSTEGGHEKVSHLDENVSAKLEANGSFLGCRLQSSIEKVIPEQIERHASECLLLAEAK